ncbi:MAG: tetratricopeptide repeat protein, partial [Planctomycetes bacterium]|nr:tetratricopeptide repeat protein [Planctomycetota bacterium]
MRAKRKKAFRFNWQLVVVLFLGLAVLAGTLYGLRKWRRRYMATRALEVGLAAYEEGNWVAAAKALGRYCPVHPNDTVVLMKYADAQRHIVPQKESNIRQAVAAYRQVLRKDPTHTEAARNVSRIYIMGGLASDAEVILERLLESATDAGTPGHRWRIGAGDAETGELLAMALVRQRRFEEADRLLEAVIEAAPGDIPAYELRASIKRQYPDELSGSPGRQVKEANEIIASAVERNPASASAHIAFGVYLERIADSPEKKAEARAQYYKAVECTFEDAATRVRLASIFIGLRDFDAAERQLALAEKAEPTMLSMWLARAALAKVRQSPSEADKVAENALEAMGEERFYFLPTAFDLFLYAHNRPKAKSCLDEIKTIDPQSTNISFLNGMMAQDKKETYKAIEYWKEAAQSADPVTSVRAGIALGKAYNEINDLQAAVKVLRQLVGTLPEDGSMTGAAELALAQTLSRARAWKEAAEHCAAAVKLLPRNVEAHIVYLNVAIHVAASSRNRERALARVADQVEKLRRQYPGDSRVAILDARIAQMQGRTNRVADVVRILEKDDATKMQGRLLDMELLWKRGQHEAAIERARDVVEDYPGEPAAVLVLADVLTRNGEAAAAAAAIEKGIDRADKKGRRDLQIALATFHRRHGDVDRAEEVLTTVTREYPEDITSRLMLLRVIGTGDPARAQELIDEVKRIEGEQGSRWRYYQAMLWLSGGQWRSREVEITDLLNANIEADPRDLASMILLGTAQEKAGNIRLAVETFRRAYEANPWSLPAAFRLIAVLQTSGELEEAGKILDEAAKRGAKETSLAGLRLGQYYREGNIDMAVETAGEMLERDPENPRLRVFVAGLKMRRKDF